MAKTRLFDEETEEWTPRAHQLCQKAGTALRPVVREALDEGLCLRDLAFVLNSILSTEILAALHADKRKRVKDETSRSSH